MLLLASVAIVHFLLRRSSFFQYDNYVVTKELCCNIDNHVLTQFQCSFFKLVSRPKFSCRIASLFRLCCNIILYYLHLCRDKGLFPLSLTSCYNFVLMFRHGFLMFSIFAIATQFSCRDKTLLCSAYSLCRDPVCYVMTELLCIVLKPLSGPRKVCRDLVSLCSAYFCVATLRSMSRHRLISSA